ncbi:MAG: transglycosylase SLT domain-containing protein [Gemmatimonadetes bacterium]|nr:transglycosylase SLT domain-containing protein [Gemmatimonadota bacterium]
MLRGIPEVWALYARVRRPAVRMLVALGLLLPAALLLERVEPRAAVRAAAPAAAEQPLAAKLAAAKSEEGPIARLWHRAAEERERRQAAATYARRFDIPVLLAAEIQSAALAEGISPRVAFGLVRTESTFRRTAVSYAGAVGYTQVLPSTARWMEPGMTRGALFESGTNLRLGFKYLRYLLNYYDGNVRLALTAYNRGPGTVDRLRRRGRNPENGYATKVLGS